MAQRSLLRHPCCRRPRQPDSPDASFEGARGGLAVSRLVKGAAVPRGGRGPARVREDDRLASSKRVAQDRHQLAHTLAHRMLSGEEARALRISGFRDPELRRAGSTYALTAADVGRTVRVREAGNNVYGSAAVDSAAMAVVAPAVAGSRVYANRGKRYLDRERPRQMQQRPLGHDNEPRQLLDHRRRPRQLPLHRWREPLSIVDPRRHGHSQPADDRQFSLDRSYPKTRRFLWRRLCQPPGYFNRRLPQAPLHLVRR